MSEISWQFKVLVGVAEEATDALKAANIWRERAEKAEGELRDYRALVTGGGCYCDQAEELRCALSRLRGGGQLGALEQANALLWETLEAI